MILDQCPNCLVKHVQTTQVHVATLKANEGSILWYLLRCNNSSCSKLVLAECTSTNVVFKTYPFAQNLLDSKTEISQKIRDDFDEAGRCLGIGCFKASLVMSRRVLQRCLKEQGCNKRNLVDAINAGIETGIIRKAFHPLAEEIRQYGNLGAHPDDEQLAAADKESAEQVLEFARLLIHEFFEVPATADALKKNREKE